MAELLFPLAAVGATFFLLIPLLALISKAALGFRRRRAASWASFGSGATLAWLVAPTLLPVLWLISSALHQTDPVRTAELCLIDHVEATACIDTLLLLGLLLAGMAATVGLRIWREWPRAALQRLEDEHEFVGQVMRVVEGNEHLRALRIAVVRESSEPIYTLGLLRHTVVIDACFVRDADHEMLQAALLHEHAHVAGLDTLRSFIVRLCLSANPAGALLTRDFERWRSAREAVCDGEAVHRGGEPLALAEGIVRAAKFRCADLAPNGAALCDHSGTAFKLRLALLLNGPPAPARTFGHIVLAVGVIAALAVPHIECLDLLERFHVEVERLLYPRH
jgi:beta-lactamase regulating signal transducer with metallopeptidase domain